MGGMDLGGPSGRVRGLRWEEPSERAGLEEGYSEGFVAEGHLGGLGQGGQIVHVG